MPDPIIKKPNQHFDATLYTGTGASLSITNAGAFKPDFVWMKGRSNVRNNNLYDSVRGTTKELSSNSTGAESTNSTGLTAFNSNGWTIGSDGGINTSSETYVGWQWKAGEGTTTVNTSGSISSNVSVNATAGFSIVTYTGTGANATVGHGLGVAPKMIIIRNRSITQNWLVYHTSLTSASYYILLNTTGAQDGPYTTIFNGTAPTSTVFSIGTDSSVSGNGNSFVAYCWAEVEGYSKFGSYTGNGSADGPFQYTGFRPKFVVIKKSSGVGEWAVFDGARETFNPEGSVAGRLRFNTSAAESGADSAQYMDFLSNGFKIRNTSGFDNDSGGTYVYMAFAEAPFKFSNAR
jgi:hypothetical protein